MNDNIRQIFNMLGVEPNENFKLKTCTGIELNDIYRIDNDLCVYKDNQFLVTDMLLINILKGGMNIVKLPKESRKKKLRDWTMGEYKKWLEKNCKNNICDKCIFNNVVCSNADCSWVNHKYLYSDAFLNKEIEVEE